MILLSPVDLRRLSQTQARAPSGQTNRSSGSPSKGKPGMMQRPPIMFYIIIYIQAASGRSRKPPSPVFLRAMWFWAAIVWICIVSLLNHRSGRERRAGVCWLGDEAPRILSAYLVDCLSEVSRTVATSSWLQNPWHSKFPLVA